MTSFPSLLRSFSRPFADNSAAVAATSLQNISRTNRVQRAISSALAALAACAVFFGLASSAYAAPITGDPQTNGFGWVPNSTNALNYAQLTPGREGQVAPYVLFNSNAVGSVTLDFFNYANGLAFFETRIDGIATGGSPHPVVVGDTIHSGGTSVASGSDLQKSFMATNYVDIRLALGAERDWDFDWVRFEVQPEPQIPLPGTGMLFGIGFVGLLAARRRTRTQK